MTDQDPGFVPVNQSQPFEYKALDPKFSDQYIMGHINTLLIDHYNNGHVTNYWHVKAWLDTFRQRCTLAIEAD